MLTVLKPPYVGLKEIKKAAPCPAFASRGKVSGAGDGPSELWWARVTHCGERGQEMREGAQPEQPQTAHTDRDAGAGHPANMPGPHLGPGPVRECEGTRDGLCLSSQCRQCQKWEEEKKRHWRWPRGELNPPLPPSSLHPLLPSPTPAPLPPLCFPLTDLEGWL